MHRACQRDLILRGLEQSSTPRERGTTGYFQEYVPLCVDRIDGAGGGSRARGEDRGNLWVGRPDRRSGLHQLASFRGEGSHRGQHRRPRMAPRSPSENPQRRWHACPGEERNRTSQGALDSLPCDLRTDARIARTSGRHSRFFFGSGLFRALFQHRGSRGGPPHVIAPVWRSSRCFGRSSIA